MYSPPLPSLASAAHSSAPRAPRAGHASKPEHRLSHGPGPSGLS